MSFRTSATVCPRCGCTYSEPPAMSRHSDEHICSNCGMDEAVRDYFHLTPIPRSSWAYPKRGE